MIQDPRKEEYRSSNPVFFDTNIWLTLFAPPSKEDDFWKNEYSKVFSLVHQNNVPIILDSIIVGEYINKYCRIEIDAYFGDNESAKKISLKDFRENHFDIYQPIIHSVIESINEIFSLPQIEIINYSFNTFDIENGLDLLKNKKVDWNDILIIDNCQKNSYSLITNDADFLNADIKILTCNPKLLNNKS